LLLTWLLAGSLFRGSLEIVPVAAIAEDKHQHGIPPVTETHSGESEAPQPVHVHPGDSAGAEEKQEESPSTGPTLSLEQLERMALESNPTLGQAAALVQAAAGRTLQAGLYPNPAIGYNGEEISTPAAGGEHGAFVQQTIVTAGKLRLSRNVSAHEQAQAEEWAKAQRLRVLNTVRLLYYQTLGAQQLVAWRQRLTALTQEAVGVSQQLFNVGQADQPDLLQAEVEAQQAQLDLGAAQYALERTWRELAAVAGNPDLKPQPLAGKLGEALPELDWDKSFTTLLEESPERKAAQVGVQRAEAALKRAQVEWIPDLTFRGGVNYNFERFAPEDKRIGPEGFAEIRIPLPVFDRNQGGIAAALADLERAQREVQRVELSLRQRLAATFAEYRTARQTVEAYNARILPNARRAYEMYAQRYQQMAAAYPQVLIAQRTLLQAQVAYVAALTTLWRSVVEIRGLLLVDGLAAPSGETATGAFGAGGTARETIGLGRTGRLGDD
jgi:cobalt-zinc-cadmium efflux system outer membrane protein